MTRDIEKVEDYLYSVDKYGETYSHETPEAAAREALDDTPLGVTPAMIKVYRFVRQAATLDPRDVLDLVLDRMDEDFGNPEEGTEPSTEMNDAAATFCAAILANYTVWRCDFDGEVDVPTKDL